MGMIVKFERARKGITDRELTKSLRKRGWKGDFLPGNDFSPVVTYLTPAGKTIAKVLYDNQKCLKKAVFLIPPLEEYERENSDE